MMKEMQRSNSAAKSNGMFFGTSAVQTERELALQGVEERKGQYIIDAMNVCYWPAQVCLQPVLALANFLLQQKQEFVFIFDAKAKYHLVEGRQQLEWLIEHHKDRFNQSPRGVKADEYILMAADADEATTIISKDAYREYVDQYPWLEDKGRLAGGMVIANRLLIGNLKINLPIEWDMDKLMLEFKRLVHVPEKSPTTFTVTRIR